MKLEDILPELQSWFPPELHRDRDLPGGGRWFYIPYQTIVDRLNQICPGHWESKYSDPIVAGDYTVIQCQLTICGVTRTGVGDDKTFPETNDRGKAKIIGTPAVRAFRNAFKDACEQFGLCSYLDEQKGRQGREAFVRYMQGKGDGRAAKFALENGWQGEPTPTSNGPVGREKLMEETTNEMNRLKWNEQQGRAYLKQNFSGLEVRSKLTNNQLSQFLAQLKTMPTPTSTPKPAPTTNAVRSPINEKQLSRFWAIANAEGKFTKAGVTQLLSDYGLTSSSEITTDIYEGICQKVADPQLGQEYNERAQAEVAQA